MAFYGRPSSCFVWGLFTFIVCSARVSLSSSPQGFVKTSNTAFLLNDSPFLFNGFNSHWMPHVAADPTQRYKISNVFRDAAAAGLTVCRTWAFSDGGDQPLQVYDKRVFQALDFMVSEARKYNIRLILSFVNNFEYYGGRAEYVNWAKAAGVVIKTDDDFYTNQALKNYYKNNVKRVLTRINSVTGVAYKDDATIMAWELINEPRCQVDNSGKTINAWVQEMATYVKSIDSNHLLEIGMEGFYGDSLPDRKQFNPGYEVGTDFITSNLVHEIDFATIHVYPKMWLPGQDDGTQTRFMGRWMVSHWTDSRNILKKPIVLSEFGKSSKDAGYSLSARDRYLNQVYTDIYRFATSGGGVGGSLVWQIMAEGMEQYNDGYAIVLSQNPSTTAIISHHSTQMRALEHRIRIT